MRRLPFPRVLLALVLVFPPAATVGCGLLPPQPNATVAPVPADVALIREADALNTAIEVADTGLQIAYRFGAISGKAYGDLAEPRRAVKAGRVKLVELARKGDVDAFAAVRASVNEGLATLATAMGGAAVAPVPKTTAKPAPKAKTPVVVPPPSISDAPDTAPQP